MNTFHPQTVVCEQAGSLLQINYDEVRQMYFQNPRFGFFFLELVAERLLRDANRMKLTPDAVPNHDASNPSVA